MKCSSIHIFTSNWKNSYTNAILYYWQNDLSDIKWINLIIKNIIKVNILIYLFLHKYYLKINWNFWENLELQVFLLLFFKQRLCWWLLNKRQEVKYVSNHMDFWSGEEAFQEEGKINAKCLRHQWIWYVSEGTKPDGKAK